MHTHNTVGNVNQDTGWVSHIVHLPYNPLTAFAPLPVRLRFRGTETIALSGPGQIEIDLVSMNTAAPTAAEASVTGRILTDSGRGISRTNLTITDSQSGENKYAITNPFGYYRFDGLATGHFYILTVRNKRYTFQQNSQSFQLNDNLDGVDFTANPLE